MEGMFGIHLFRYDVNALKWNYTTQFFLTIIGKLRQV